MGGRLWLWLSRTGGACSARLLRTVAVLRLEPRPVPLPAERRSVYIRPLRAHERGLTPQRPR